MKFEIRDLHKTFGEKEVLHGISFEAESGKALGLLGRNGAGKTTTIRILMNVFHANSGEILIDGKKFNPKEFKIGYLPEERGLFAKKTVLEQLIYLGKLKGLNGKQAKSSSIYWLKRMGVYEYANKKLETLSKGNQQKVQLASALIHNPQIVILDEPFSGLDPVNSQILKEVVQDLIKNGKVVIFSSHQMSYIEEFCEDICIINKGNVVLSGKLKDIKKQFGENKMILSAENYDVEQLQNKCDSELENCMTVLKKDKQHIIFEADKYYTKNELIKRILDTDISIEHIGMFEPSLNDIFIERVGE